jgi:5-methyltetrahydrofolate--homocysteine methyltransferase
VLDVNVGHPQIDEAAIMPKVVEAILAVTDVPLCIDSNEPKILEAGLKGHAWKAVSELGQWRR